MTVYRHVRTGRLPAIKQNGEWKVRESDLEGPTTPSTATPGNADLGSRIPAFIDRLTAGDEPGCWAILENCLSAGAEAPALLHELIVPAMALVGDRWSTGDLKIVSEHTATTIAHRLVARLGPMMRNKGRSRGTIVLGAVAGDTHALPVAILADILRSNGFSVIDLGGNTPAESFAELAQSSDQCRAVGISASIPADDELREAVAAIQAVDPVLPILLGGRGIRDADHAHALGSDGYATGSYEVVELFERCIADPAKPASATYD